MVRPSPLAPHDDHADCTEEMGIHPLYLSPLDQSGPVYHQTSHLRSRVTPVPAPLGIHYLDDFPANAVYQPHLLPKVLGQHHLGSLGEEQYRLRTTGGVRRCALCRRGVMLGGTLDDRGAEGPNLCAVVVADLPVGAEESGRVLEIKLCFRRLPGEIPLEKEVPVILSQLAASSQFRGISG